MLYAVSLVRLSLGTGDQIRGECVQEKQGLAEGALLESSDHSVNLCELFKDAMFSTAVAAGSQGGNARALFAVRGVVH